MRPRAWKLPDRSFKVKFKIFRFGFTDFEMFVRRFVDAASWQIRCLNQKTHTYTLHNGWSITLHRHGDISLYSPLLEREQAIEVYGVIDVLLAMDVRVGENCEVAMHYERSFAGHSAFLWNTLVYSLAAAALALFLGTKTAQLMYLRTLSLPFWIALETSSFALAVVFAWLLYKGLNRDKERFEEILQQASQEWAHEDFMCNEDVRRKTKDPSAIHTKDLLNEISYPLENIMAYTRFYSTHSQQDTQHWKDLMEIMGQATRMREVMNRVETNLAIEGDLPAAKDQGLFRKSHRRVDLVSLAIRGTDVLSEPFQISCYTINLSETGVCLLLPDRQVAAGQTIELHNQGLPLSGIVRWVVLAKTGNMMFAGVEFCPAKKAEGLAQPNSNEPAVVASH